MRISHSISSLAFLFASLGPARVAAQVAPPSPAPAAPSPAPQSASAPDVPGNVGQIPTPATAAVPAGDGPPVPSAASLPEAAPAPPQDADAGESGEPEGLDPEPDQDERPPAPVISGYVEAGYDANLSGAAGAAPTPLRAYDGYTGFKLRSAHLALSHAFSPLAEAVVSVDLGTDAAYNQQYFSAAAARDAVPLDLREGFLRWAPGAFTFVFGRFLGGMGAEVVSGPSNGTVSRGLLYRLAMPVTHTGAKVVYSALGGAAQLGVGVANGWNRLVDDNAGKTLLFEATLQPGPALRSRLSGTYGAERPDTSDPRLTLDLTTTAELDGARLALQLLYGSERFASAPTHRWFGVGLHPHYVAGFFSLGARVEYFNDRRGSRAALFDGGTPVTHVGLMSFTICPGVSPASGLTLRAEYRADLLVAARVDGVKDTAQLLGESASHTVSAGAHYVF